MCHPIASLSCSEFSFARLNIVKAPKTGTFPASGVPKRKQGKLGQQGQEKEAKDLPPVRVKTGGELCY